MTKGCCKHFDWNPTCENIHCLLKVKKFASCWLFKMVQFLNSQKLQCSSAVQKLKQLWWHVVLYQRSQTSLIFKVYYAHIKWPYIGSSLFTYLLTTNGEIRPFWNIYEFQMWRYIHTKDKLQKFYIQFCMWTTIHNLETNVDTSLMYSSTEYWPIMVLQWIKTVTKALNLHHISPLYIMISIRIQSKNKVWP